MSDSEDELIENIFTLLREIQEEQKNLKQEIKKVKSEVKNKLDKQKNNFISLINDFEKKTNEEINESIKSIENTLIEEIKKNPLTQSSLITPK